MSLPKDRFQTAAENPMLEGWKIHIKNIEDSLDLLEQGIEEAESMNALCIPEWCRETEKVMIGLNKKFFSIGASGRVSNQDSAKIRSLKMRLHELYRRNRLQYPGKFESMEKEGRDYEFTKRYVSDER